MNKYRNKSRLLRLGSHSLASKSQHRDFSIFYSLSGILRQLLFFRITLYTWYFFSDADEFKNAKWQENKLEIYLIVCFDGAIICYNKHIPFSGGKSYFSEV